MYKQLSVTQKDEIVQRILKGESVSVVAREAEVSRTIIYKWVKLYKKSASKTKSAGLKTQVKKGKTHWKTFSTSLERKILVALVKNPSQSISVIADSLGISRNGVWKVSLRHNLNTETARRNYNYRNNGVLIPETRLEDRIMILKRYEAGEKITKICQDFNISRQIFYIWLKRYQASGQVTSSLSSARPHAEKHWKFIPEAESLVIQTVTAHPELSAAKISETIAIQMGMKIGHSHIHKILTRLNLNTYEKRLRYVTSQVGISAPTTPVIDIKSPVNARYSFISFLAPPDNASKPKIFVLYSTISFFASLTVLFFSSIIIQTSGILESIGMIFAITSLIFGMFFLVYSFKYYLTVWLVLSHSRKEEQSSLTGWKGLLSQVFGIEIQVGYEGDEEEKKQLPQGSNRAIGLKADLSQVTLERLPFISVHVSIYNEKRVIDRLLTACTSFDYPNYEVVVADDSTDETYDLIKQWAHHPRVKISHRTTRDGYKGQALQQALKVTNPRAEFIAVFDADFIPYPDSLTQFLKYMQESVGSLAQHELAKTNIAAVQGYQWHVLNKSENWITRGIRTEYSGSYVIERSGEEIYHGLKQISGSVYMIRKAVLDHLGWGRSITEDFQLTLRLYEAGYKVVYTPYIQAPAEAASTIKRLIRQRMRWAEGHSYNVKQMFGKMFVSPNLTRAEKLEFAYLVPYYLQAAFFIIGTLTWFLSEAVFQVRLPFWTEVWGWSLVFTNLFALPLMNMVGLFMEESEEKDYVGLFSFVALSYIVAPFQAYAAIKGFLEKEEGPWFRTPKTGRITDTFLPGKVYRFVKGWFGSPKENTVSSVGHTNTSASAYLALATANNTFNGFFIRKKKMRFVGNATLGILLILITLISGMAPYIPATQQVYASQQKLATVDQIKAEQDQKKNEKKDVKAKPDLKNLLKNVRTEPIDTPRIVTKKTKGGKQVSFVFHKEARVRILLDKHEVEFTAQMVAGRKVHPSKATIYEDHEVVYTDILPGVDLKYTIGNDVISEEYIVKTPEAAKYFANGKNQIASQMKTSGVNVVNVDKSTFGLYGKDGKELFKFSSPFAKDAKGVVTNDIAITLEKAKFGYTLSKVLSPNATSWLNSPERAYPISIDPTVIVSGGIVDGETQFGGLQRKVAYVNSNWYAFYGDGTDVWYNKSSDGVSWGSAVDMDGTDADNINPSISVSGNTIMAFWFDTGSNLLQGRTINTASSDTQGTLCSSGSLGTIGSTFMLTAAAVSTTQTVVAYSDTSSDTEVGIYNITGLNGTCTVTDVTTGNITFGSGITAGDRPVVVAASATDVGMIFQDGDLSYSKLDPSINDWRANNLQVANVTDNVYSVTTDGTTIWTLSVSGTTATNLYACCNTIGFSEVEWDSDTGSNGQDNVSDIAMTCPAADDCKYVFTDDLDTTAPRLWFVDCDDATCSTGSWYIMDSDIGGSGNHAGASVYCVSSTDCKIAYADDLGSTAPKIKVIDCGDSACSSISVGTVDSDIGGSTVIAHTAIDCVGGGSDCKVLYNFPDVSSYNALSFFDCSNASCSTGSVQDVVTGIGAAPKFGMTCPAATDCKFVFHDSTNSDLDFIDCANAGCTSATLTNIDATVGGTSGQVPVSIACPAATDCKVVYGDQVAGSAFFVDCPDATCTSTGRTITTIDVTGGANASADPSTSLYCVSATDCKFTYVGDFTSGSEKLYFVDCNDATCSTGSVARMPGPRFKGAVACPASTDCKFAYYDGTSGTNPTVQFADCSTTNCFPTSTSLTAPWTSETNVTSVSLSYDSTNTDLVANILKDASNQAYFKTSDASSISWSSSYTYGFTAGSLAQLSSPMTGAGTTQMGVVVRQGSNFEFATLPENIWILLLGLPFLLYVILKRKRKASELRL